MKNKKWLTYTLATLLTLIALAVVGLAAFRVGMTQNAAFPRMRPEFNQSVDQNAPSLQGANPGSNFAEKPQNQQRNPQGNDFHPRGFERGHRGMPMIGGLFGLIHIAMLALLLWFGYKLVQKSGWKFVRVQDSTATSTPVSTEIEEKKESE